MFDLMTTSDLPHGNATAEEWNGTPRFTGTPARLFSIFDRNHPCNRDDMSDQHHRSDWFIQQQAQRRSVGSQAVLFD